MVLLHFVVLIVRLFIFQDTSSQNSLSIGIEKFTQLLEKMQRPCLEDSCPIVALETPSR